METHKLDKQGKEFILLPLTKKANLENNYQAFIKNIAKSCLRLNFKCEITLTIAIKMNLKKNQNLNKNKKRAMKLFKNHNHKISIMYKSFIQKLKEKLLQMNIM